MTNLKQWISKYMGWDKPWDLSLCKKKDEPCGCRSGKAYEECCYSEAHLLHDTVCDIALVAEAKLDQSTNFTPSSESNLTPLFGELVGFDSDFLLSCILEAVDETVPYLRTDPQTLCLREEFAHAAELRLIDRGYLIGTTEVEGPNERRAP